MIQFSQEIFPYAAFTFKNAATFKNTTFKMPNSILGKQAEAIFEHLIRQSTQYKLLAANTQIQGKKETLGELDYLLQDLETQNYLHIEIACKFYLFDTTIENIFEAKWIGPNKKDTLLDKLNKLTTKQFPLLHRPELDAIWKQLQLKATQFKQQHCILSSLYIPENLDIKTLPQAYQSCVVGRWVSFEMLQLEDDYLYAIPSKKEWLLPVSSIQEWYSAKEIYIKITEAIQIKKSPQVYKKNSTRFEKFFVVWWETP